MESHQTKGFLYIKGIHRVKRQSQNGEKNYANYTSAERLILET